MCDMSPFINSNMLLCMVGYPTSASDVYFAPLPIILLTTVADPSSDGAGLEILECGLADLKSVWGLTELRPGWVTFTMPGSGN